MSQETVLSPEDALVVRRAAQRLKELASVARSLTTSSREDQERLKTATLEIAATLDDLENRLPQEALPSEFREIREVCRVVLARWDALMSLAERYEAVLTVARCLPRDQDHQEQARTAILELLSLLEEARELLPTPMRERVEEIMNEVYQRLPAGAALSPGA